MASETLTLEFDQLPVEAKRCAACIDRLGERLQLLNGIGRVELLPERRRVVLSLKEGAEKKRVEEAARKIMSEVAEGFAHDSLRIGGMDCPACAAEIQTAVAKIPGVLASAVDFPAARLFVEYEMDRTGLNQIQTEVRKLGFSANLLQAPIADTNREQVITLAIGTLIWLIAWLPIGPDWWDPLLFVLSSAICGWRMAWSGLVSLANLKFGTNTLMTIAVIGALALQEWKEGSAVVLLFALGNLIQSQTMQRTRTSLKELIDAAPKMALVKRNGLTEEINVREVKDGDEVEVRPFSQIPVDGEVIEGEGYVDNSKLTGESEPRLIAVGSKVLAGSSTKEAFLIVRASGEFAGSTYAKMLDLIERGQSARAPQQEMIDRVTAWYTPGVLIAATLFATLVPLLGIRSWIDGLHQAFWLLMVACPCALVISTPVASVTAIGAATRMGALVKGAAFLEMLSKVKHWVFDKTGTLTYAKPVVNEIATSDGYSRQEALILAASLAAHSSHPLSRAIVHEAAGAELKHVVSVREFPGLGIEGTIDGIAYRLGSNEFTKTSTKSTVNLSKNGEPIAGLAMGEAARAGANETISEISKKATLTMLTGDESERAEKLADLVGVVHIEAGLSPDEKAQRVEALAKDGGVAMVGDGVNDTAALQRATVAIAMGAVGSDAAIESADIVLLNDDIRNVPRLLKLSRKLRRVLAENITFSLATKAILLVVGGYLVLPFWLAVAGDMGVSVLVTLNALRLRV